MTEDSRVDRPTRSPEERRASRAKLTQSKEHARQRRVRAFGLRLSGCSYREMAVALGVSVQQAFKDFARELAEVNRAAGENLAQRRSVMLAQIDRAKRFLSPKLATGDPKAADALVRLLDREAKLTGADAPVKHAVQLDATLTTNSWVPEAVEYLSTHYTLAELRVMEADATRALLGSAIDVVPEPTRTPDAVDATPKTPTTPKPH